MDPKEAPNLADEIRIKRRLSPHETAKIIGELSKTVDYLYFKKGILHKDLKPSNIFVDPHFAKIGDFGIASSVKRSGYGTYIYKAPECLQHQSAGSLQSEVFSLGVIAYEMLTGQLPVKGFIEESKYDSVYFETPEMKEVYGEERIERLKAVLKKALSTNPENRYQTAGEFSQALKKALGEE